MRDGLDKQQGFRVPVWWAGASPDVDRALGEKGEGMETVWSLGPSLQRLVADGGDPDAAGRAQGR